MSAYNFISMIMILALFVIVMLNEQEGNGWGNKYAIIFYGTFIIVQLACLCGVAPSE